MERQDRARVIAFGKAALQTQGPYRNRRDMVHPKGFEPLASAFGGQRSIQLSYGCALAAVIG